MMNRRQFFTTLAAATFAGVAGGGMSHATVRRAITGIVFVADRQQIEFVCNPHLDYHEFVAGLKRLHPTGWHEFLYGDEPLQVRYNKARRKWTLPARIELARVRAIWPTIDKEELRRMLMALPMESRQKLISGGDTVEGWCLRLCD